MFGKRESNFAKDVWNLESDGWIFTRVEKLPNIWPYSEKSKEFCFLLKLKHNDERIHDLTLSEPITLICHLSIAEETKLEQILMPSGPERSIEREVLECLLSGKPKKKQMM